jgi:hypothetical protein
VTITKAFVDGQIAKLEEQAEQLVARINQINGAIHFARGVLQTLDAPEPDTSASTEGAAD